MPLQGEFTAHSCATGLRRFDWQSPTEETDLQVSGPKTYTCPWAVHTRHVCDRTGEGRRFGKESPDYDVHTHRCFRTGVYIVHTTRAVRIRLTKTGRDVHVVHACTLAMGQQIR